MGRQSEGGRTAGEWARRRAVNGGWSDCAQRAAVASIDRRQELGGRHTINARAEGIWRADGGQLIQVRGRRKVTRGGRRAASQSSGAGGRESLAGGDRRVAEIASRRAADKKQRSNETGGSMGGAIGGRQISNSASK